ncbi:MAG: GNAT family N-acetyltransferase [Clostridiales bacterium]|nr:GNAT family N-acetyltransferase [Clostridiales bacterium]
MSAETRLINCDELPGLMRLYRQLHPEDPELKLDDILKEHWDSIFNDPNLHYIVAAEGGEILSTCTISIIRNLTRGMRPYGLIENVVTDINARKRGLGTGVLRKAVDIARENNCYKVMLMTGSKEKSTLRFYEEAGFASGLKTGFVMNL